MRVCIYPAGTGGVSFYRVRQPLGKLQKEGRSIFLFEGEKHDGFRVEQEQRIADIIVYQCPWSEAFPLMVHDMKKRGKKIVIEVDDNLFAVNPWNEKYSIFGFEDIELEYKDKKSQKRIEAASKDVVAKDGKDGSRVYSMWTDGKYGFDKERNRRRAMAIAEVLKEADLLTVTTQELGMQMRKYRPHGAIAVIPNLIDPARWLPMKKNESDEIRIGWQGGSAHFHDLYMIAAEIKEIMKKNPKVKLVLMGVQFFSLFEDFADRVEWHPWHGDINTYPLMVRNLKLDIALCPLENDLFNKGKSPLKWEEMGIMKVPCVLSSVMYNKFIKHRKTGLIAEKGQWEEYLQELIDSKELRKKIAENAYQEVITKFNVSHSEMWWEAFRDLMFGKMSMPKVSIS